MGDYYHHFLTSMAGVVGNLDTSSTEEAHLQQFGDSQSPVTQSPLHAPSTTSKDSGSVKQQASPTSSHEAEDVEDDVSRSTKLETIPDEDEDVNQIPNFSERPTWSRATSTGTSINQISRAIRQTSESPSADGNVSSPSNSTRTSSTHTATTPLAVDNPTLSTTSFPDWTHLSPGVQRYMNYFYKHMDHHNYCIVHDGDNFFHGILPNFALQNEALLNAIVGFSAYLYSLEHNPNGKMWEFLQYYNRGVTLLLASLKRKEKPDIGTLLTILQLATIEMTSEEFETAHAQTLQRLRDWKVQQDAELEDPTSLVTDFTWAPVPDEADIVSPFSPGMLYDHPKLSTTFLTVIWLSMIIMHQCQSPTSDRDRLYSELAGHAYHVVSYRWKHPSPSAIRNLADERNATAINAQEENLREVRHIFTKMQLAEGQQAN
ncbi:hypothetical protein ACHAPH_008806 [Verticillium nonalfalfae]